MGKFSIFDQVKKEGRSILTEFESKKILKQAGISVIETKLAKTQKEAVSLSQKMGFPVALKITSPDVIHKSDSGGVKLSINSVAEVKKAYDEILKKVRKQYPDAIIHGVSVQKMALAGTEVIVGSSKDPQFGPVIMFGLGGIYVNFLRDVAFRLAPLSRQGAKEMVEETKAYTLLRGIRGEASSDIDSLIDVLLRVSKLVADFPEINELDINPLFVYEEGKGCLALDVKMTIKP